MKPAVFLFCLMALSVGGCSWIPRTGPSTSDVLEQGQAGGEILFDVVQVDDRVVNALIAQPKERFAARFQKDAQPPEVKIAIGDTVSVLIWESAAGGLFSEAPPAPVPVVMAVGHGTASGGFVRTARRVLLNALSGYPFAD